MDLMGITAKGSEPGGIQPFAHFYPSHSSLGNF
jgi:hypothetical protein